MCTCERAVAKKKVVIPVYSPPPPPPPVVTIPIVKKVVYEPVYQVDPIYEPQQTYDPYDVYQPGAHSNLQLATLLKLSLV